MKYKIGLVRKVLKCSPKLTVVYNNCSNRMWLSRHAYNGKIEMFNNNCVLFIRTV